MIYIAGKYSGSTKEETTENCEIARQVAIKVWNMGIPAICPHLNTFHFDYDDRAMAQYNVYLDGYIKILSRCDAIIMLKNWESSFSARSEHATAIVLNMPIFYSFEEFEKWADLWII